MIKRRPITFRGSSKIGTFSLYYAIVILFLGLTLMIDVIFAKISIDNTCIGNHEKTSSAGCYDLNTRNIFLFSYRNVNDSLKYMDQIYFHEKCHYYWYEKMTQSERSDYNILFETLIYSPSSYALTSVEENFADTCSIYTLTKSYFNKTPDIDNRTLQFMEKLDNLYTEHVYYIPNKLYTMLDEVKGNLSKEIVIYDK